VDRLRVRHESSEAAAILKADREDVKRGQSPSDARRPRSRRDLIDFRPGHGDRWGSSLLESRSWSPRHRMGRHLEPTDHLGTGANAEPCGGEGGKFLAVDNGIRLPQHAGREMAPSSGHRQSQDQPDQEQDTRRASDEYEKSCRPPEPKCVHQANQHDTDERWGTCLSPDLRLRRRLVRSRHFGDFRSSLPARDGRMPSTSRYG
jgi:hypothetical protein